MKTRIAFATLLAAAVLGGTALAQNPSHQVSVDVQTVELIDVSQATVELILKDGTAGTAQITGDPQTATLSWTSNEEGRAISVEATHDNGLMFDLFISGCNSGPGVSFSGDGGPTEFRSGVGLSAGTCDVTYEGVADVAVGTGAGSYTVTYTLTGE